jgi:Tfp pilus assembly protein PilV
VKDDGASLIEILIALMILAFAGTVLVGGMFMARVVSDKSTVKRQALAQLSEIVQELNAMPFIACNNTTDAVYPTPAPTAYPKFNNVTVDVEVLDATSNSWVNCSASLSSPSHGIQRITVSTTINGQTFRQVMVKTRG